ncbi:MAG: thiol:disulfide interchange protein DsbA/DsbL [Burkholderiales bacterium]
MKRVRAAGWLGGLVLAACAAAAAAQIQAGREFLRLEPRRTSAADARIEVVEFFYYGCPVCYDTQPGLTRWLAAAPGDVAIRRVPALSSEKWEPHAKLFHALESLGQIERLHWPIYDNLHFWDVRLDGEKAMADWAERNGIERQKFLDAYGSAEVAMKVTRSRELLKSYDVRGVPTFIVDGKFLTSARLAGGTKEVIEVVDHLVRLAREERSR